MSTSQWTWVTYYYIIKRLMTSWRDIGENNVERRSNYFEPIPPSKVVQGCFRKSRKQNWGLILKMYRILLYYCIFYVDSKPTILYAMHGKEINQIYDWNNTRKRLPSPKKTNFHLFHSIRIPKCTLHGYL